MKLLKAASALLCAVGLTAFASVSNATATITDSDGQTWNGGTWIATMSTLTAGPTIAGIPITPIRVSGTLNASGVLAGAFTDTSSVDQRGTTWSFHICPNASAPCADINGVVVAGATPDLSAVLSAGIKAPRFPAGPNAFGYLDAEVLPPAVQGATYYNVILQAIRQLG